MNIIHTDPHIVVVNKPGGLLSVPGRGPDKQDCVVSRIKKLFPTCIKHPSVHRLDMYTSGLLVLALTQDSHKNLSRQFENRAVTKKYRAILNGIVTGDSGEIHLPFRLDPDNRPYQIYDPVNGKFGITKWKKIAVEGNNTWVEFIPVTGRTHQLRVHSSHQFGLGCPIVGDALYGEGREGGQMMLHASFLRFIHPANRKPIEFKSDVPF